MVLNKAGDHFPEKHTYKFTEARRLVAIITGTPSFYTSFYTSAPTYQYPLQDVGWPTKSVTNLRNSFGLSKWLAPPSRIVQHLENLLFRMNCTSNPQKQSAAVQFNKLSILTPMSCVEFLHDHVREIFFRERNVVLIDEPTPEISFVMDSEYIGVLTCSSCPSQIMSDLPSFDAQVRMGSPQSQISHLPVSTEGCGNVRRVLLLWAGRGSSEETHGQTGPVKYQEVSLRRTLHQSGDLILTCSYSDRIS